MKRRLAPWLVIAVFGVAPAWVLSTESGLRAAFYLTSQFTGGAVSAGAVSGRLIGDVRVQELLVRTAAAEVRVGQADLNLRLSRLVVGRVQAERLALQALAVTVHDRPPAAGRKPIRVEAPLRLAVEDGTLSEFRLQLEGSGRNWTLPEARFAARWRGQHIVIARLHANTREAGVVQLRGRIAIADDLLAFEDFEVEAPSRLRIEGAMALTAEAVNALTLSWENLRWPDGTTLPWLHSPRGTLALEGPWRDYAWSTEAETMAVDIPGELAARGRGDLRALRLAEARLRALAGTVSARGRIDWAPAPRTDLALEWNQLDPSGRLAGWPGQLNGTATLKARWDEQRPQIEFDGALRDSQLRGYPLALQARGRTEQGAISLQQFAVQSGVSELRAAGQLWPQLAVKGSVRSADLNSLWAGLSGQGEARFSAQGEPAAPRITAQASVQALDYRQFRAARLTLDANVAARGRSELSLTLVEPQAGVTLKQFTANASGTRDAHRVTFTAIGAEGEGALVLQGGERGGEWRGQLEEARFVPAGGLPWTLEEAAAVRIRRAVLRIEPACLRGGSSRACADLDLGGERQRIAFRLHEFALQHLRSWLPPDWVMTGTLGGTAALELRGGELTALSADLAGSAGSVEGDGVRLDFGPGLLRVEPVDRRLHATLKLAPAGGTIEGEVWVAPGAALLDRPMLGDLSVKLPDLSWLPVLSPEIAAARGSIDADLNVSGTLRGPALDGRLQVADGRVRLATPGIELTEISASFDRGRAAPLNARLSAKSGEGQFTLEGVLRTMQPKLSGSFTLKGQQVLGFNTPELRAWITPDLKLTLDGRRARFTGEVAVPRAEITPRQLDAGGIGPSRDQVVVSSDQQQTATGFEVESQVRIALGDKVRFDGLGLKTRLEGAITAYDEIGRPTTGRGELRLVGGRYKAYGQDLQIETGRLLFSGGPITDPAIDLSAYRKPLENLKVGLRARGTLAAPEFSLYSEPAMSQEEQLSWLVLGRSLEATLKSEQGSELSGAAASLGLSGGDLLAQQLAPRLGFDEVSLGARPGETADLARLTIGKYLSPKLFISYGVGLFQPGHFFRLQYDLSKRFKLVGESGLQQGGDVLYSIESGR